mmetsp:Transcript_1009/g.3472  ORF Transcript_1009/g.3472 Transcript_1009/m.3472 type:complete len:131 (-) Transcript_1009:469-861(-)
MQEERKSRTRSSRLLARILGPSSSMMRSSLLLNTAHASSQNNFITVTSVTNHGEHVNTIGDILDKLGLGIAFCVMFSGSGKKHSFELGRFQCIGLHSSHSKATLACHTLWCKCEDILLANGAQYAPVVHG